jgi:plastocyanin
VIALEESYDALDVAGRGELLKRTLLAAIVIGVLAHASAAWAVPTEIVVDDSFYAPDNPATRNLSDGVSFHWQDAPSAGLPHNVRQDATLFSSGALTSGTIDFSIRASAGTYHYYCTLHGSPNPGGSGMDGVVKVRPVFAQDPTGLPFTVRWALSTTGTGNRFDVRFRIGTSGTWTTWKNDVSGRSGVFGQNGQPVQVTTGKTYKFQARSLKAAAPNKPSGWSPTLSVNT